MDSFFFYGTLLFPEVLEIVLGRTVDPSELHDAYAYGFRRIALPGHVYPVLRHAEGVITHGKIIENISAEEQRRLDFFEAEIYSKESIQIQCGDRILQAYAYLDPRSEVLPNKDWDPTVFKELHLSTYLQTTKNCMKQFV
jgi:hypothetical protein